ncbi:MAG TPA: hypothetical protein VGG95_10725 [Edaphobacter sp.]
MNVLNAFAQQNPVSQAAFSNSSSQTAQGSWPTPDEVVSRMNDKLNLSEDQKSKITPIISDRQTQMKALMADGSGRRMQKAKKAKSIMSDSDQKIMAVLNDDQKKKYEQMKDGMRDQMRARMQQRQQQYQ